jgi:hypothetical protein
VLLCFAEHVARPAEAAATPQIEPPLECLSQRLLLVEPNRGGEGYLGREPFGWHMQRCAEVVGYCQRDDGHVPLVPPRISPSDSVATAIPLF